MNRSIFERNVMTVIDFAWGGLGVALLMVSGALGASACSPDIDVGLLDADMATPFVSVETFLDVIDDTASAYVTALSNPVTRASARD